MKKIFGFVTAILYDIIHTLWGLSIALIIVLSLLDAKAKADEPKDDAHDHMLMASILDSEYIITITIGSFDCPKGEHRAIMQTNTSMTIGCATISKKAVDITWETGIKFHEEILDKDAPPPVPHERKYNTPAPRGPDISV